MGNDNIEIAGNNCLTGKDFLVIGDHLTFPAGSRSAAVCPQSITGTGGSLIKPGSRRYGKRLFLLEGDAVVIHFGKTLRTLRLLLFTTKTQESTRFAKHNLYAIFGIATFGECLQCYPNRCDNSCTRSSLLIRSCLSVSRSRIVTVPSCTV